MTHEGSGLLRDGFGVWAVVPISIILALALVVTVTLILIITFTITTTITITISTTHRHLNAIAITLIPRPRRAAQRAAFVLAHFSRAQHRNGQASAVANPPHNLSVRG